MSCHARNSFHRQHGGMKKKDINDGVVLVIIRQISPWAISVSYAYQRTWKPFNPILGEKHEMVNHDGITFIAEQAAEEKFKQLQKVISILEDEEKCGCVGVLTDAKYRHSTIKCMRQKMVS